MSGPRKFIVDEFNKDSALFFAKLSNAVYYTPKSFTHFLRMLNVPIKLVLKTLSGSFFETSIAGSAQQSMIKSNFSKD